MSLACLTPQAHALTGKKSTRNRVTGWTMTDMRKNRAALNANWALRVVFSWVVVIAGLGAMVGIASQF